jgi:hypothetical protein
MRQLCPRQFLAIAVCIAGLGLAACTGLFGPTYALRLGYLETYPSLSVTVPDTVAVSTDFDVSFHTSGGGCTEVGTTKVAMVDGRTAEIRPYDYFEVNPQACTTILQFFPHYARLQFGQAGTATLRVIGASGDSTITVTRTVVVR